MDLNKEASMDRNIADLNIRHFRKKLAEESDDTRRQMILRLLAEEEEKLAMITNAPKERTQH